MRAFYQRIRARRGHQIAIVAAARKLACLFWCLLTRGEDYAFGQPSLTAQEAAPPGAHRRRPALARPPRRLDRPTTPCADAERDLARQAEHAYTQTVRDRQAAAATKRARARHRGAHHKEPSKGKAARQTTSP